VINNVVVGEQGGTVAYPKQLLAIGKLLEELFVVGIFCPKMQNLEYKSEF